MTAPGWVVGPVAATLALVALAFVWLGLYASGGGLLIAAGIAFWAGAGVAAMIDPPRSGRNAFVVAAYVVLLLAVYLASLRYQTPPPGTSSGGANVEAPR
jgi:hypothetical protein